MVRCPVVGRGRSSSLFHASRGAGLWECLSRLPVVFQHKPPWVGCAAFSVIDSVLGVFLGPLAHESAAPILRAEPPALPPQSLILPLEGHFLMGCTSGMLLGPAHTQGWWLRPKGDDACRSLRPVVPPVPSNGGVSRPLLQH